ncbi:carbohydrate binding family 9 domain-containing protein, partial [Candidatus Latescibacterota bacterium]
ISPLTDFIQFDPYNGQSSHENTVVRITYDADNLYILCECFDSNPSTIAADLTPRELYNSNDYFTIIIDTYFDNRNSYSFTVNPLGIQKDSPGDYVWESAAQIGNDGWKGEIKIPFKSIRLPHNSAPVCGINFKRYIFRYKETSYLMPVGRDDVLLEKNARMDGLKNIKVGKNLEFFPYTGVRVSESEDLSEQKFAAGLDAKCNDFRHKS